MHPRRDLGAAFYPMEIGRRGKSGGFDPIWAIGCDNRYITHSVINPPPTAAGVVDGVVRGADERQSDGGELMRGWRSAGV